MFTAELTIKRINQHEARIHELEGQLGKETALSGREGLAKPTPDSSEFPNSSPSNISEARSNMDKIDLGPPIATLRSLRALAKEDSLSIAPTSNPRTSKKHHDSYDPVLKGILSFEDAQRAIDM